MGGSDVPAAAVTENGEWEEWLGLSSLARRSSPRMLASLERQGNLERARAADTDSVSERRTPRDAARIMQVTNGALH